MKLYKAPPPPELLRVNIKQQGGKTFYITVCQTNKDEVIVFIKKIIEYQNLSPFNTGRVTSVEVRQATGSDNGPSKSISFKGLTTRQTYELLYESFKELGYGY